jgi:hypothetical protein
MDLVIRCECGATVRGESEAALLAAAEAHIEREHPPAAGAATSADLLAMAVAEKEGV